MSEERTPADWSPCIGCGLCCDGTLFDMIKAAPEEGERLRELAIPTSELNAKSYFALPCRFSSEGRCGIYADRFKSCHSFRCKVLRDFQAGALIRERAQEKVGTALKLRSEAAACDPAAARLSERVRLRGKAASERLLLKMAALDYFLDMHFRNKNPQVVRGDAGSEDPLIRP